MGLFRKKKEEPKPKQDIIKEILEKEAQKSPSERFVSGAIFDISRKFRSNLMEAMQENNAVALLKWFVFAYSVFLSKPETVGINSAFVNAERDDTNPVNWNADIINLDNKGDCVAFLYMPVQNKEFSAGVVGIIIGECGDGYYYCMLNTDENKVSEVFRNKASQGIHKVGEVSGLGFELMNSFVECIKNDYLSKETDSKEQGEGEPEAVYFLEHKAAPKAFYSNPMGFFDILSEKDGFYKMMKKILSGRGLSYPFEREDVKTNVVRIEKNTIMGIIQYPDPKMPPHCYRAYVLSNTEFNNPVFYTIEKGINFVYLCKWFPTGEHLNIRQISSPAWNEEIRGLFQSYETMDVLDCYHSEFGWKRI